MSSTRRKDPDDDSFSQGRYASSRVFEPGLLANLVARRCKTIKAPQERALVWWLQAVSHHEGGLEKFADHFLAAFPERRGTPAMRRIGKTPPAMYTEAEAAAVADELHEDDLAVLMGRSPRTVVCVPQYVLDPYGEDGERIYTGDEWVEARVEPEVQPSQKLDVAYYQNKVQDEQRDLANVLRSICLDPEIDLAADSKRDGGVQLPFFDDLIGALRAYRLRQVAVAENAIAETTISKRVFDDLDYAAHCKGLVVIEGDQRTGKSTAAKNWCDRHPGQAVYVKLGVGNDDASFFRSIARALGTAASLTRKPTEMQMRIEDALQEGHLMLVLDEAHFLFAQTQRPRSAPSRLDWVRTALVDFNVPVALISTPQFDHSCGVYEKQLHWNAAQIRGRVKLKTLLPSELPAEDLVAVARKMAPHADEPSLERLVGFAQSSDDYLAGIERLATRASYFAVKDGREVASRADIKRALDDAMPVWEAVAPSAETPSRKQSIGVRAIARQAPCKGAANNLPPALARRSGMDLATTRLAGSEAGEQLQFSEATPSE